MRELWVPKLKMGFLQNVWLCLWQTENYSIDFTQIHNKHINYATLYILFTRVYIHSSTQWSGGLVRP